MDVSEGSQDINQQFIDGGVIPGQLVGQEAVSKTYVDGQNAGLAGNISTVAASAAAAQATANTGVSAAGAAQSTANTAVGLANNAQGSANTAQATVDLHKVSTAAHSAANITYAGPVEGAANTKQAIDLVKQRVDTIVAGAGESNTEILDARQPATGPAYPILGARLNGVDAQLADITINVKSFGAVGNGLADDTAALLAAKTYVLANGGIFYIPPTANCYVSGDLDLFGLKNVQIEGTISGAGTNNILTLGYSSTDITATTYFVNNASNIRLRFTGLKNADSKVNQCSYLQLWADGDIPAKASLAYCKFTLGIITKLEFNSQGGPIGWINENAFYGGRISEMVLDGNYQHNNNRFMKPMFDSGVITINKGGYNQWIGCRFEGTPTITFAAGTTWNRFGKSWYSNPGSYLIQTAVPAFTDNGSANKVTLEDNADYSYRKLFEINSRSANYNTARLTRNAETITGLAFSNVWESDYIRLKAPLGFQFLSDAALFRSYVYFYDSSKTLISVQPSSIMSGIGYTWTTDHYINTSSGGDVKFALFPNPTDSNIVYAKIILQQYAAGTFEAGMIKVLEQKGRETNIITPNKYQHWTGTAAPTAGSWEVGDVIYNSTPTAGGYVGWVCVATGSPGTWKGFGTIQA